MKDGRLKLGLFEWIIRPLPDDLSPHAARMVNAKVTGPVGPVVGCDMGEWGGETGDDTGGATGATGHAGGATRGVLWGSASKIL